MYLRVKPPIRTGGVPPLTGTPDKVAKCKRAQREEEDGADVVIHVSPSLSFSFYSPSAKAFSSK